MLQGGQDGQTTGGVEGRGGHRPSPIRDDAAARMTLAPGQARDGPRHRKNNVSDQIMVADS